MSVVSAVEYARNAAAYHLLPDLAISSRRPGPQRDAVQPAPGRGARRQRRCCGRRRRARRCCCSSCSAAIGGASTPRFATVRAEAGDLDALAGLPHEAVLVIGDAALLLAARGRYPHVVDLGAEWKAWTGLPFVFAVWAARRDAAARPVGELHRPLLASRAWGLAHLDVLAADAARSHRRAATPSAATTSAPWTTRCAAHSRGSPTSSAGWPRIAWCRTDRFRSSRRPDHVRRRSQFPRSSGIPRALRAGRPARARPPGRRRAVGAAPRPVVTYIVDRNINYTNVCVADCGFCAFYRRPKARGRLRPVLRGDRREDRRVPGASAACRSCCRAGTTPTSRSSGTSS